jgi:metal-dependent amidase/aminoacylase/carboxypeptidase family protein
MKVNRCLRAGAQATGARVIIETLPGYLPLNNDPGLTEIFKKNSTQLLGEDQYLQGGHGTGSTDMGDISQIMPALHPGVGGAGGVAHSADFRIEDKELAYVAPAKLLALSAIDLLYDNAAEGRKILENFTPRMTKQAYLDFQNKVFQTETYDGANNRSEYSK